MKGSPEIATISKALVAAQAEMKNPAFDTTNPHFRNRFASLAAIRNAVVPILTKHGIFVTQDLTNVEGGIACTTILVHESGQFLEFGPLVMPATKQDAQGYGSASTYCKRYSLQSVCGVVGDDDDDGNAASAKLAETNGKGDRSGRPDTSGVDTNLRDEYVQGFTNCLLNVDTAGVLVLHDELKTEHELYTAVSDRLSSKQRTDLRAIITAAKQKAA